MFKISVIITATILETRCWRLRTRHAFIACFNLWEWNLHSLHLTNSEAGLSRFSDLPKFIWVSTWQKVKVESESEVAQSCPTLCDPMDCSLPDSSVHGIIQSRILEWVAISFSRGSSQPRDWTQVSCIRGRCFNLWDTREAGFKPRCFVTLGPLA